jgi:hypothetical protein
VRAALPLLPLLLGCSLYSTGDVKGPPAGAPARASEPRTLFIALDAVAFQVVEDFIAERPEEAPFSYLQGPVPLVSSYPSATTVAFTGIFEPLGIEKPPGYEARFYDLERDQLRGGGLCSYNQLKASWREFFDWRVHSIVRKSIGFVRPVKFGLHEIERAIDEFFATDDPFFFAYVGGTDGVGHLKGPEAIERVLAGLDAALREARAKHPAHNVVVFSDHGIGGGEPLENVRKAVKRAARAAGFDVGKRVRANDDITIVSYGLLSNFVVFTEPAEEERAARALVVADGVELCALRDRDAGEGAYLVVGEGGVGHAQRRARRGVVEWSYRVEGDDPLDYLDGDADLPAGLFGDPIRQTWLPDRELFEATAGARFPDALHRIARAFDLVKNPASLVCSVERGHMYGAAFTNFMGRLFMGRLRWTHGALHREDSLGFLLTDHPGYAGREILRFDTSLVPFLDGVATLDRGASAETRRPGTAVRVY